MKVVEGGMLNCGHEAIIGPMVVGSDSPCPLCDSQLDLQGINSTLSMLIRAVGTLDATGDQLMYAERQALLLNHVLRDRRLCVREEEIENVTPTMDEAAANHLYNTLYPNKHEVSRGAKHDRIMGIGYAQTTASRQCVYCKSNLKSEEPQHHSCVCPWLMAHNALVESYPSWFGPLLRGQVQGFIDES